MKSIAASLIVAAALCFGSGPTPTPAIQETSASTYEHLATVIIEVRKTEDGLVKGILQQHMAMAAHQLASAKSAQGPERSALLESAAAEIANIANEGDKRIQAVRQRLLKAGHTHHTDAETKMDYMFINGKEKKGLLEVATRVGQLGANATPEAIAAVSAELTPMFEKAIAEE